MSATFAGGASIGTGCGSPAKDDDNGFFCLWDAGVSTTTSAVNLLSVQPFGLNFNTDSLSNLGTLTVLQDAGGATGAPVVLLPAAWIGLFSAFAGLGALGKRRA